MNKAKHIRTLSKSTLPASAFAAVPPFFQFLTYLRYLFTGCVGQNPKELQT